MNPGCRLHRGVACFGVVLKGNRGSKGKQGKALVVVYPKKPRTIRFCGSAISGFFSGALSPCFGEDSPTKVDYRKSSYPYSNLSTGGPRYIPTRQSRVSDLRRSNEAFARYPPEKFIGLVESHGIKCPGLRIGFLCRISTQSP